MSQRSTGLTQRSVDDQYYRSRICLTIFFATAPQVSGTLSICRNAAGMRAERRGGFEVIFVRDTTACTGHGCLMIMHTQHLRPRVRADTCPVSDVRMNKALGRWASKV